MKVQDSLKQKIFMVLKGRFIPKEFAAWLYEQRDLAELMSDDLVFALYSFNYEQPQAQPEFRDAIIDFFDPEEYLL